MHRQACFDGCFVELRPADGKYTAAEFKQIIDHGKGGLNALCTAAPPAIFLSDFGPANRA